MLNTAIERKLSVNCILHLKLFLQNMFWSQSFGTQKATASTAVHRMKSLNRLPCLPHSVSCGPLTFQWGVQVSPYHRLVKISEGNQEPSRSGLGP